MPDTPEYQRNERNTMQIPKDKILEMLQQQGKGDQVDQAKQELPDQVDTDQHADLLQKFGLNPRSCSQSSAATSPACESAGRLSDSRS